MRAACPACPAHHECEQARLLCLWLRPQHCVRQVAVDGRDGLATIISLASQSAIMANAGSLSLIHI
eukprot:4937160-Alexandrium_andersonii.AAC.1